ncbi:MAG: AbrB/MazE/SpoVT family DNA-binding domain-containing protein [Candidatus Doudnabacteria bacterium]|nr:AbrB/MazE/SpoVT family DNA-binding domain-containing protein [Candidatus Doudnabacteria bacterium]
MAKSKQKKVVHHLIRLGKSSLSVVLPANLARSLGWKKNQRVVVKRVPRGILVKDAMTKHR